MKLHKLFKLISLFILLFSVVTTEAQKKKVSKKPGGKKKVIKFAEPVPIPSDYLKSIFRENQHVFIWQPEKDTNLPASFLYRDQMEILPDTVVIKKFYTKKPMDYHTNYYTDYGANEDNEIYYVKTEKAHYKLYYETLSIWNADTKKYDKYELSPDGYMSGFAQLVNLKTMRKYIRDGIHNTIGPKEYGE